MLRSTYVLPAQQFCSGHSACLSEEALGDLYLLHSVLYGDGGDCLLLAEGECADL